MADLNYTINSAPERMYGQYGAQNGYGGYFPNWGVGNVPVNTPAATGLTPTILNKTEIDMLNRANSSDYRLNPEELARYLCDHKDETGKFIAKRNEGTSEFFCPRCGRKFTIGSSPEKIDAALEELTRAAETIKMINTGNISNEVIRSIFTSVGILKKALKDVYKLNITQWSNVMQSLAPNNNGGYNGYGYAPNVIGSMIDMRNAGAAYQPTMYGQPVGYGVPQYQQPPVAPVYGQPVGYGVPQYQQPTVPQGSAFDNGGFSQQPPVAPVYGQPVGYGVPQYQQPPVAPGVANITANPVIPQQPAAPTAPVDNAAPGLPVPPPMSAPTAPTAAK